MLLVAVLISLVGGVFAHAQLRPQVTPKPKKPAPTKPAKPAEVKKPLPGEPAKAQEAVPQPVKAPEPPQIIVETSPNAEVYLDDEFKGRASPEGRLVASGLKAKSYKLRISLAGKQDYVQQVEAVAGGVVEIKAALADLPGRLLVRTSPGAEVFVDGSSRGMADANGALAADNLPPGAHEVRVSAHGKKDFRQNVAVVAGQETTLEARLEDLAPTPGTVTVKENAKDGFKYVWIPPGTFQMGCSPGDAECQDNERPAHRVTISKGFWLGQTEVTVGAYKRFATATGRGMPEASSFNPGWSNERMPIANADWEDAEAYCRWAGGRLPTEAEWEYGARGGSNQSRYGPLDEIAWCADNSGIGRIDSTRIWRDEGKKWGERLRDNGNRPHEVAQKRANGFGLFDMLGNVGEWVNDWYGEKYYEGSPKRDPQGPGSGEYRAPRLDSAGQEVPQPRVSLRAGRG